MKRLFSGLQPSGELHIGNYLGAIRHWVELQQNYQSLICVVDLHAITVPQVPDELRRRTFDTTRLLLACGIDPSKTVLFRQSDVPAHAELGWMLNCITSMGELTRMTQFKDKSQKAGAASASVGLFDYPVLQAADVLAYGVDVVPVGEDQKQHLELMRDLAQRFNKRFGETLVVPQPLIQREGGRIAGLDDPAHKMSKSAGPNNYIALLDNAATVAKKIARAVTDSNPEITADPARAGVYNLLEMYSLLEGVSMAQAAGQLGGKGAAGLKAAVTGSLNHLLEGVQQRYRAMSDEQVGQILVDGKTTARELAASRLLAARKAMGLA